MVQLWRVGERASGGNRLEVHVLSPLRNATRLRALAFDHSNTTLAVGGDDGRVQIWSMVNGSQRILTEGHDAPLTALAFSLDGGWIASGAQDGSIYRQPIAGGGPTRVFVGHTSAITSLAFLPSSHQVASASSDGTVRIWNGE